MNIMEFIIKPVGFVESTDIDNIEKPSKDDYNKWKLKIKEYRRRIGNNKSIIRILPEYESLLEGIDDFSHILIIFWPHKLNSSERKRKRVHPMGCSEIEEKGIFATRSPARPNPVLVTSVKLIERDGALLKTRGLEAFEGTPVIDIKPVTGIIEEDIRFPDWIHR